MVIQAVAGSAPEEETDEISHSRSDTHLAKTQARHDRFEHPTAAILKVPSLSGA
jgi:hypothetical protein